MEAADIKATIQLNAGNGTPQEAADWVQYCIDQELDVATFAVGNEVHFAEERVEGMTVTKTPQEYIDFYNAGGSPWGYCGRHHAGLYRRCPRPTPPE